MSVFLEAPKLIVLAISIPLLSEIIIIQKSDLAAVEEAVRLQLSQKKLSQLFLII